MQGVTPQRDQCPFEPDQRNIQHGNRDLFVLSLTGGSFNTGVGAGTLLSNIEDENTAIGAGAILSNTTGALNTANGAFALFLAIRAAAITRPVAEMHF